MVPPGRPGFALQDAVFYNYSNSYTIGSHPLATHLTYG